MFAPRGPLPVRQMAAHWVVIAAAALTALVAAAVGAALTAFAGQALPQAVRHDLAVAPGTALTANGSFSGATVATTTDDLRSAIGSALSGVPFGFWQGIWSDPLGLVPGSLPAPPPGRGGNTPLLEAASLDDIRAHAVLVSGAWPSNAGTAGVIPAALPASAAALLKLHAGETIGLRDRASNQPLAFKITGLYAQRQLSGTAASYWQLSTVPADGSVTAGGFITYGPLIVAPSAFSRQLAAAPAARGQLPAATGTWVAQPDMSRFTNADLSSIPANVRALTAGTSVPGALSSVQFTTKLPTVLADTGSNLAVARSLLAISALQLAVLALAALTAVARLLAAQRESETSLLTARGATRWQLVRVTAVFTVIDADGAVFQLPAQATLPADGKPHVVSAPFSGASIAYPLRLTASTSPSPVVSEMNFSSGSRPSRCRSTSIGKSRDGRRSPYQDDLSAPPRPKTSGSGRSSCMSGAGMPTSTTTPARSRADAAHLAVQVGMVHAASRRLRTPGRAT